MDKAIQEFLKPTKSKIVATFISIVVLMITQALAVQSWPNETLFSIIHIIVFTPADFLRQAILSVTGPSLAAPVTFILDILTYYILGCFVVYIMKLYKKER
jgi:hypothetical protein